VRSPRHFPCRGPRTVVLATMGRGGHRHRGSEGPAYELMQTFVSHSDFESTARALDTKRLDKQWVEVIQIIRALTRPGYGWAAHPAVLMWKDYEEALGCYGLTMCAGWVEKGFRDSCAATIASDLRETGVTSVRSYEQLAEAGALPQWLFDPALLRSHQSALVRKDPGYYRPLFPEVPTTLPMSGPSGPRWWWRGSNAPGRMRSAGRPEPWRRPLWRRPASRGGAALPRSGGGRPEPP